MNNHDASFVPVSSPSLTHKLYLSFDSDRSPTAAPLHHPFECKFLTDALSFGRWLPATDSGEYCREERWPSRSMQMIDNACYMQIQFFIITRKPSRNCGVARALQQTNKMEVGQEKARGGCKLQITRWQLAEEAMA